MEGFQWRHVPNRLKYRIHAQNYYSSTQAYPTYLFWHHLCRTGPKDTPLGRRHMMLNLERACLIFEAWHKKEPKNSNVKHKGYPSMQKCKPILTSGSYTHQNWNNGYYLEPYSCMRHQSKPKLCKCPLQCFVNQSLFAAALSSNIHAKSALAHRLWIPLCQHVLTFTN